MFDYQLPVQPAESLARMTTPHSVETQYGRWWWYR